MTLIFFQITVLWWAEQEL